MSKITGFNKVFSIKDGDEWKDIDVISDIRIVSETPADRAKSDLLVLADWLEESGCNSQAETCRRSAEHIGIIDVDPGIEREIVCPFGKATCFVSSVSIDHRNIESSLLPLPRLDVTIQLTSRFDKTQC